MGGEDEWGTHDGIGRAVVMTIDFPVRTGVRVKTYQEGVGDKRRSKVGWRWVPGQRGLIDL